MNEKEFFIVTSAFNNSAQINYFLNSLKQQTFKNWKLYIADDNSQDETFEKIQKVQEKDPRIFLFKNKYNIGLTNSLNKLIEKISPEGIIIRLDTNEIHNKYYLEKITSILINKDIDLFLLTNKKVYKYIIEKTTPFLRSFFITFWGNVFYHGSSMYSKELFKKCQGYKNYVYFAQDHVLWVKMLFYAKKIYISSSPNLKARQLNNKNRISIKNNIEQGIFSLFVINEFINLLIAKSNKYYYKIIFWCSILLSLLFKALRLVITLIFK